MWTIIPYKEKFLKFKNPLNAKLYTSRHVEDLLSSTISSRQEGDLKSEFQSLSSKTYQVFIVFYDYLNELLHHDKKLFEDERNYVLKIEYQDFEAIKNLGDGDDFELTELASPQFSQYEELFQKVYDNLLKGNCYQINLTRPFEFGLRNKTTGKDLEAFSLVSKLWQQKENIGAYANATFIPSKDKLYLSNSPECLFRIEGRNESRMIKTFPIKGTAKFSSKDNFQKVWHELVNCPKNQAELDMITDLMRNDLSSIGGDFSEVISRSVPLRVPGILHQFSIVQKQLKLNHDLWDVVKRLFPGGSITGAPKERVSEMIHQIEGYSRGFYCGSTIISHGNYACGSINIRSSEVELKKGNLFYGAGGGITLQSQSQSEFEEMLRKVRSFSALLDSGYKKTQD
ncbi:MAG: chorismate-binding protein [Bacteriovoracaceae bacterium]